MWYGPGRCHDCTKIFSLAIERVGVAAATSPTPVVRPPAIPFRQVQLHERERSTTVEHPSSPPATPVVSPGWGPLGDVDADAAGAVDGVQNGLTERTDPPLTHGRLNANV
jgi:hypothetical protein